MLLTLSLVAALSQHTSAHGIVSKIVAGTKTYQGYDPNFQYMPTPPAVIGWAAPQTQDRGPVDGNKLDSPDIICQRGATNAKISAEVAAGGMVSLQWTEWPESHKGLMLDYLADCGGDCSTVDKTALKTPARYADDDMIKNNNAWTVQIPASIKAGNYVLRHETIALHQAQGVGGAQSYPQCFNLKVTGGGSDTPEGVVGTALYMATDPGIMFNIYQPYKAFSDYLVPGPPLYSGAASAGAMPAATGTSAAAASSTGATKPDASKGTATSSARDGAITDNAKGIISTPADAYKNAKRMHARDLIAALLSNMDDQE
ncbi:hypothetical protein EJ08DRAFT_695602 [Tothia fuscella]|uniref:Auxiliary Activity family 9 catalytic domain-containing protein n=1 Tax=Tothia fuscella TaxID=1048955 RepID=A0A9P4NUV9_9PEZI|nr:hypothetical protein EJ08DRAFT_695602 [Tothia fuscella]